jgi:hypothetical protein
MPRRDPAKAVQVLDLLLGSFGDDGEHWLKNRLGDGSGNRCLVGALRHVRLHHRFKGDGAGHYLADAIPCRRRYTLIGFNDACDDFDEIRTLIVHARDIAQAKLAATAQPERLAA